MKTFALLFAALIGALLAGCSTTSHVAVQTAPPPPAVAVAGASAGSFNAYDRNFVLTAASGNMFEIGASEMAPKHTSSPDVLALAAAMNRDHVLAMNNLMALMQARGMAIPQDMAPDKRRLMDRLGTNRGADFDQVYVMEAGVHAHQADIAAYQQAMPMLSDPQLKAWVAQTLPAMQQHLSMAQQIATKLG